MVPTNSNLIQNNFCKKIMKICQIIQKIVLGGRRGDIPPCGTNQFQSNSGQFVPKIIKIAQIVQKIDLGGGGEGKSPQRGEGDFSCYQSTTNYPGQFAPKIIKIGQIVQRGTLRGISPNSPPRELVQKRQIYSMGNSSMNTCTKFHQNRTNNECTWLGKLKSREKEEKKEMKKPFLHSFSANFKQS